jgi:phage-related protein
MINHFIFGGRSSIEFGIAISGEATYNTPLRRSQQITIPGRSGALTMDEGAFDNVEVKYPALIKDDFPARWAEFMNFAAALSGYQRLEDTYHPYVFRKAQLNTAVMPTTAGYANRTGLFDVTFNCKPQQWLKSGEQPIVYTGSGTIYNRTQFGAAPLLTVYGAGTVRIGGSDIVISSVDVYVTIDCETMDAYKGSANCNSAVSFSTDKVEIPPGESQIVVDGMTRVDVIPRWYII